MFTDIFNILLITKYLLIIFLYSISRTKGIRDWLEINKLTRNLITEN